MYQKVIDSHIHLDLYHEDEQNFILQDMSKNKIEGLITVSNHLESAIANVALANRDERIKPAFGFHPEQPLPVDNEIADIEYFIEKHQKALIAVGEVGLPYYLRTKHNGVLLEGYLEILELFICQAIRLDKPIILHAIYDDASTVCDLLEKYSFNKAHFHWFKGDWRTIERMAENGYSISITPDVVYEEEIQQLVTTYPLSQMMVETDGPWPFLGPFENKMTHPKMIHQSIREIATIKKTGVSKTYQMLFENTKQFYNM